MTEADPAARYERLNALFFGALERPEGEREAWLVDSCADPSLRAEVLELLAAKAHSVLSEEALARARRQRDAVFAGFDSARPSVAAVGATPAWMPEYVADYRVLRVLGQGGMGVVYEAQQASPSRRVALKLVHPLLTDEAAVGRLEREAAILARLRHPGIAQVFASGSADLGHGRQPWFAMELVEGVDLRTHASEHGLDVRTRLELMARVADAVHHAHERGVVHRDLKPDNILVDEHGQPKVLDFGVARASDATALLGSMTTASGALMGTLAYMAPEQLDAGRVPVGPAADVYALGVVAFELLAGQRPLDVAGLSLSGAVAAITGGDVPQLRAVAPDLSRDAETIVAKAMSPEVERRYPSAAALADDIRRFLAHRPLTARPTTTWDRARRFTRRHRGLVAGVVVALLALLAGALVALDFALDEQTQRDLAETRRVAAEQERSRADSLRVDAERRAWRASVAAASESLSRGDISGALRQVEAARAYPDHGWEVELLDAAMGRHDLRQSVGGGALQVGGHAPGPMALDPTGRLAVFVRTDGVALAWDLVEGVERARLPGMLLVAPRLLDGQALLLDDSQHALRWDPRTGARETLADLSGHGQLARLQASADGKRIMASGAALLVAEDGHVRVLARRGAANDPLPFAPSWLSADGERIISIESLNWDISAVTFDVATGERSHEVLIGESHLIASHDAFEVLASADDAVVSLFRPDLRRRQDRVQLPTEHNGRVSALAVSDDGRLVASASDVDLCLWDVASASLLATWSHADLGSGSPRGLRFTHDGDALLAVKGAQLVRWPVALDPDLLAPRWSVDTSEYTYHAAFSSDGTWLAARSAERGPLRLVDTRSGREVAAGVSLGELPALAFTADRTRLVVALHPQWVELLDLASGVRERRLLPVDAPAFPWLDVAAAVGRPGLSLGIRHAASADGRRMASTDPGGWPWFDRGANNHPGARLLSVWDADTDQVRELPVPRSRARGVAWRPDGGALAVTLLDGGVARLDPHDGAVLDQGAFGHGGTGWGLAYSPDGRRLASAGHDGQVLLWDADDLASGPLLSLEASNSYTYGVSWSPDGSQLAATTGDGRVVVWDAVDRATREREAARSTSEEPARTLTPDARRAEAERLRAAGPDRPESARGLRALLTQGVPDESRVLTVAPERAPSAWLDDAARLAERGRPHNMAERLARVPAGERDWLARHLAARAPAASERARATGIVDLDDGPWLVLARRHELERVHVADPTRRVTLYEVEPPVALEQLSVRGRAVAFVEMAPSSAGVSSKFLVQLDAGTGERLARHACDDSGYLEVSADGRAVLVLSPSQQLAMWDVSGLRWQRPLLGGGGVYARWGPGDQRLLLQELTQDGLRLGFLDRHDGAGVGPTTTFLGQRWMGLAEVVSGGETVIVGLGNGRVLELDGRDLSVRRQLADVGSVAFGGIPASADGRWLVLLTGSQGHVLLDRETGVRRQLVGQLRREHWTKGRSGISVDGRWIALAPDDALLVDRIAAQPVVRAQTAPTGAEAASPGWQRVDAGTRLAHPHEDVSVHMADGRLRVETGQGATLDLTLLDDAQPAAWRWSADGHALELRCTDGRVLVWHDGEGPAGD